MFSTCIFCGGSLGRNEVVEEFPVRRRLAFDADRGRLWVLCAGCRQWNLSPLEERWEALESLERISRDTRASYSTGEISLVRHPQGLDLVRVGRPQLPEYAAWRYGTELIRRRRRHLLTGGGSWWVEALSWRAELPSGWWRDRPGWPSTSSTSASVSTGTSFGPAPGWRSLMARPRC